MNVGWQGRFSVGIQPLEEVEIRARVGRTEFDLNRWNFSLWGGLNPPDHTGYFHASRTRTSGEHDFGALVKFFQWLRHGAPRQAPNRFEQEDFNPGASSQKPMEPALKDAGIIQDDKSARREARG